MRCLARGERGNVATELAMVLPLLLLFLGGIIDFGRAFWYKQTLAWASREGARQGAVMSSTTWDLAAIKTKVVQSVQGGCGVQLNDGNVSVAPDTGPVSGADITVTVTMPFSFLMVPITINNLSGQTIMRFETG